MPRLNVILRSVALFSFVSVCLWFAAANFLVRSPYYQMHSFTVVPPPEKCPGAPVESEVSRTLRKYPYLKITDYVLTAKWINAESGQSEDLPPGSGTLADKPAGTITEKKSAWVRAAPTTPGMWRLQVGLTLHGKVLGLPRQWPISYESKDLLKVFGPYTKECRIS